MDANSWLDKNCDMTWGDPRNTSTGLLLTNTALIVPIRQIRRAPSNARRIIYDDPATGERVRSYSMNGVLGGHTAHVKGPAPGGGLFLGAG